MKILLIEDNITISKNIVRFLSLKDIKTDVSLDWENGLNKAIINFYDVIILDINLPKKSWIDILKTLREKQKNTSILMLSSNSLKEDIVSWLNFWADDYLTKPFDFDELYARILALYRRNLNNKSNNILLWDYVINLDKIEVIKNNEVIKLSPLEFNLFKYLAQNQNKAISRKELYEKVWWEFDWDILFSKTVDVYIWYLRKKLDKDLIKTIPSVWYSITF